MSTKKNHNRHATFKDAALKYAAAGFRILRLDPEDNEVIHEEYYDRSTTDPEQIEDWWDDRPRYKIGYDIDWDVVVICLEPDPLYEGRDGIKNLARYTAICGELPHTASCIDQSSGMRLLFYRVKPPFDAPALAYPGVHTLDWKYYVTIPGSTDGSGDYHWEDQSILDGIADADENVMRFITSIEEVLGPWSEWRDDPRTLAQGRVVPIGERLAFLYNNLKLMHDRGYHRAEAEQVVKELNYMCCKPPLHSKELTWRDIQIAWDFLDKERRNKDYVD